MKRKLEL
jgi:hypothetical protein